MLGRRHPPGAHRSAAAVLASAALAGLLSAGCSCAAESGNAGRDAGPTDAPDDGADGPTDARTDARTRPPDAPDAPDARPGDAPDAPGLGPPYPVVLAHGFFGFDDFAGIGFIDYFFRVEDTLRDAGERHVYVTEVDPFASSRVRADQLLAQIRRILRDTGYARVNLVAHSQGGLDARIIAHDHPELVASVTTISTPHQGTPVSDVILRIIADDRLRDLLDALVRVIGALIYDTTGAETSVFDALAQFSSAGIAEFNAAYPDAPGVAYFSIAGRSGSRGVVGPCLDAEMPWLVERWNLYLDPLEPLFAIPGAIVSERWIGAEVNDGLVAVESARWGRFLGCIPADHMDEIGHLLGDSPGLGNGFDHLVFYQDLVAFLRAEGL